MLLIVVLIHCADQEQSDNAYDILFPSITQLELINNLTRIHHFEPVNVIRFKIYEYLCNAFDHMTLGKRKSSMAALVVLFSHGLYHFDSEIRKVSMRFLKGLEIFVHPVYPVHLESVKPAQPVQLESIIGFGPSQGSGVEYPGVPDGKHHEIIKPSVMPVPQQVEYLRPPSPMNTKITPAVPLQASVPLVSAQAAEGSNKIISAVDSASISFSDEISQKRTIDLVSNSSEIEPAKKKMADLLGSVEKSQASVFNFAIQVVYFN